MPKLNWVRHVDGWTLADERGAVAVFANGLGRWEISASVGVDADALCDETVLSCSEETAQDHALDMLERLFCTYTAMPVHATQPSASEHISPMAQEYLDKKAAEEARAEKLEQRRAWRAYMAARLSREGTLTNACVTAADAALREELLRFGPGK